MTDTAEPEIGSMKRRREIGGKKKRKNWGGGDLDSEFLTYFWGSSFRKKTFEA